MPLPLGTPQATQPLPALAGQALEHLENEDVEEFCDRVFPGMTQHTQLNAVLRKYKSGIREIGCRKVSDLFSAHEDRIHEGGLAKPLATAPQILVRHFYSSEASIPPPHARRAVIKNRKHLNTFTEAIGTVRAARPEYTEVRIPEEIKRDSLGWRLQKISITVGQAFLMRLECRWVYVHTHRSSLRPATQTYVKTFYDDYGPRYGLQGCLRVENLVLAPGELLTGLSGHAEIRRGCYTSITFKTSYHRTLSVTTPLRYSTPCTSFKVRVGKVANEERAPYRKSPLTRCFARCSTRCPTRTQYLASPWASST